MCDINTLNININSRSGGRDLIFYYEVKVKQFRYRPGVAQRVPET
jgi:hypothetical protein